MFEIMYFRYEYLPLDLQLILRPIQTQKVMPIKITKISYLLKTSIVSINVTIADTFTINDFDKFNDLCRVLPIKQNAENLKIFVTDFKGIFNKKEITLNEFQKIIDKFQD